MYPCKIIKLRSGETIITKIVGKKSNKLMLENPMLMKINSFADPFSNTRRDILTLTNWLEYAQESKIGIPEDWIALFLKPDAQASRLYEAETNKPKINIEEMKRLEDLLNKEGLDGKEDTDELPLDPSSIFMSFAINPNIFKQLIEEGYLEDEFLEEIEDDIINNDNGMHETIDDEDSDHRSGKENDFGNTWNDWSPDIRDYL